MQRCQFVTRVTLSRNIFFLKGFLHKMIQLGICFSLYGVHVIAFLLDMESYMTTLQQELYECIQERTL
jgi:hypothetical protein